MFPQEAILAKSQKKSNREAKKPKQDKKPEPVAAAASVPSSARKK
jgi:hypothetical protein